ncbi:MAG TPA: DUF1318 domain-containing protein [Spirochaetota bacterium]|nr:DUF1318 domain-containing protein [Spirochaetota bacterium]HPJ36027.1 DUF1318 domain-containing protein [Spirochaetota bacterium]
MKRIILTAIITAIACYAFTGCKSTPSCLTVVPPEINLTGEKTVIERQIVGDYMELEKDAWTVSSVRTTVARKKGDSNLSGDQEIIKAIKAREFHADRIRDYKTEGVIGETAEGYISYIPGHSYEKSAELKKVLLTIIDEENSARKNIFTRTLSKSGKKTPSDSEVKSFGRMFADEQRALAQKGDWIQDNSGKWTRKK